MQPSKPVETAFIQGVNGRLRDEGLAVHHFTSLAEGQTKNEAWRRDEKQHRPHGAHGHPTPIMFITLDGKQAELLLSPRMYWKDNRVPCSGQPNESRYSAPKPLRLIGVSARCTVPK